MSEPKSSIVFLPGSCEVVIDGSLVGVIQMEEGCALLYPENGTCIGADEMIEIGNKMKEMEKE